MRQYIRKIGLYKSVALFTALAVCLDLVTTLIIILILGKYGIQLDLWVGLIISVIITLIITPTLGFFMVRLFLKVDKLEEEMRQIASYDLLTGLLSRREFLNQANFFHRVALREKLPYALVIVDLDNFKEINDQFGHLVGDQTLKKLGEAMQSTLRESDLACRWGGDEFVFFLPNTNIHHAEGFCTRIHKLIKESSDFSGLSVNLCASIGVSSFPDMIADNIEELLSAADTAMYMSKKAGGNQTRQFHSIKPS